VLLNLLPGLRELRAPLAAGYLWLLAGWLVLGGSIDWPDEVEDFLDQFSSLGEAAALTFAAYVVGSFLTDLLAGPWRYLLKRRRARTLFRWVPPEVERRERLMEHADGAEQKRMSRMLAQEALMTNFALDAAGAEPLSWRGGYTLTKVVLPRQSLWAGYEEASDYRFDAMVRLEAVAGELDIARFRLLAQQPDLHNEVDRLRGEGQFKLAIATPLLLLAIVLSATQLPAWLASISIILALVSIGGLGWQGLDRLEDSGDRVADALRAGQVSVPALETPPESVEGGTESFAGTPIDRR
jgi:hypothetical protein